MTPSIKEQFEDLNQEITEPDQDFNLNEMLAKELGLTIEESEELQESNSKTAKDQAKLLLPICRAWLGATALRELFISNSRNEKREVRVSLEFFGKEFNKPEILQYYTKKYCTDIARGDKAKQEFALKSFITLRDNLETNPITHWAMIRAMNQAIQRANYGNFKNNRGFIYTGTSDHKITVTMITGQYKWTEPTSFTLSTIPASTEEEYLKPYKVETIQSPDNPDESVKVRVYKRTGTAVHPSSSVSDVDRGLDWDQNLLSIFKDLSPGQAGSKQYDSELSHTSFEREAEHDVERCIELANERGIKIWPMIKTNEKKVVIYHAGNEQGELAVC